LVWISPDLISRSERSNREKGAIWPIHFLDRAHQRMEEAMRLLPLIRP